MATTDAENKDLVRGFFEDVWNAGNVNRVEEYMAADFVEHSPLPQAAQSASEYREEAAVFQAAFPDIRYTIEDLVAEDAKVGARVTVRGTHEGELMGAAPTGTAVEFAGMAIFRIDDGEIVEMWVQGDFAGLMDQLGIE